MTRIILFTLGSVQEYIMESRRVVDLVNSSKIISSLMVSIKNNLKNKFNSEILLPYYDDTEDKNHQSQFPNYLIVKYKSKESKGPVLEKYIKCFLRKKIKSVIEKHKEIGEELKSQIYAHGESILDIYWIETEIKNDDILKNENEYKAIYEKLHSGLEAIKNVKRFNWEPEQGRKCSICGKRNAIFYRKTNKGKLFDIQPNGVDISNSILLKKGEGLCGACYLKRSYDKEEINVKSTAQIALDYWEKINKEKSPKQFEDLKNIIKNYKDDSDQGEYQLRYKDAIINEIKKKHSKDNTELETIKKLFEEFEKNNVPQEKYFCIYRADIDDLGKWMSGLYKQDNTDLLQYQQNLSQKINEFLKKVKGFFTNNDNTVLVYAGGDDILALLPIRKAFQLAEEIQEYFKETVKANELFKELTFSQGIFITHYKDTLKESLLVSQERLTALKEKLENVSSGNKKNGLVVAVLTEGYSYREFISKNKLNNQSTIAILEKLRKYFTTKSSYFHNDLATLFLNMDSGYSDLGEKRDVIEMLKVQQKRLLKRSCKDKEDLTYLEIEKLLLDLLEKNNFETNSAGLENYFNMFYIIKKIATILGDDIENEITQNKA